MTLETILTVVLVLWAIAVLVLTCAALCLHFRKRKVVNTFSFSPPTREQVADVSQALRRYRAQPQIRSRTITRPVQRSNQSPPSRLPPSPAPAPSSSADPFFSAASGYVIGSSMHSASDASADQSCRAPAFSSGGGGDYGGGGASGSWDSGSSSSDSSSSSSSDSGSSSSSSD